MTLVPLLDLLRTQSLALLGNLLHASLEATVVIALAWGLCKVTPSLPAAVRAWLWWLVSLKLLLGLLPLPSVALPWLPATALTWSTPTRVSPAPLTTMPRLMASRAVGQVDRITPVAFSPRPVTVPYATLWPIALLSVWLLAAVLQAAGLLRALRSARYLRRHAEPAASSIVARAAQLVRMFALPVMPRVLASRLGAVPLLTGVFRPAILLPLTSTDALSRGELDLVIGHELAHVRRGDLAWGWVPAIAARLFFFHPLARLAVREYLAAREEACDAEVLQTLDAAPADYGRLLVKLGVATTDDVLAAAGSSPTFEILKRRLIMLDRSCTPASRWWWTIAGAAAVLVPLTLVAQPIPPTPPVPPAAPSPALAPVAVRSHDWPDSAPPPPPPPPVAPEAPAPPPAPPVEGVEPGDVPPLPPVPLVSPVAAVPSVLPVPPAPPAAQESRSSARRVETPWVLLEPGGHNIMSGDARDRADAERQRQSANETLLWFRYAGTPYVTRDAATITAVRDAFGPVNAVSEEMKRIGEKMGAHGSTQGAVGSRQATLGAQQAELAAQMAKAAAAQAARAAAVIDERQAAQVAAAAQRDSASEESGRRAARQHYEAARLEYDTLRKEQRAREAQLDVQMKALGDQQRALGDEMSAFGQVMAEHGAQMEIMGRKLEGAVDEAMAQLAGVFDSAITSGTATRAK